MNRHLLQKFLLYPRHTETVRAPSFDSLARYLLRKRWKLVSLIYGYHSNRAFRTLRAVIMHQEDNNWVLSPFLVERSVTVAEPCCIQILHVWWSSWALSWACPETSKINMAPSWHGHILWQSRPTRIFCSRSFKISRIFHQSHCSRLLARRRFQTT